MGSITEGVWKWIAAILLSIMLAGSPAVIQAIRAPSREDVQEIQDSQVELLVRLARVETELAIVKMQLEAHQQERK